LKVRNEIAKSLFLEEPTTPPPQVG
jgi:hypothetical protein